MSETSRQPAGVDRGEITIFVICTLLLVAIVFAWNLIPVVTVPDGRVVSLAEDQEMTFLRGTAIPGSLLRQGYIPVIGELPPQSISKLLICVAMFLISIVYALIAIARSEYRRYVPQFAGLGAITFLAWVALNYWVIANFLNAPTIYAVVSTVLLIVWGGAMAYFVARLHDPMALFLVRLGLGLSIFISIVQILALLTPGWRTPTQGIPVLYNVTLNALLGLFLAGAGGNMLWRERRTQVLAGGKRR
jgi:hypothetical protein